MPALYSISLMCISFYLHPLMGMHQDLTNPTLLTEEQNEFISTVDLYKDIPHRISFEKLEMYKNSTKKLFNKKTHPYLYKHLKNTLRKTELHKSILIISTPTKNNQFSKKDCILKINWLASTITKLQEKQSSFLSYCTHHIGVCQPLCILHLQNNKDFIHRTCHSISILEKINIQFTPTIVLDNDTIKKSMLLKKKIINLFTAPMMKLPEAVFLYLVNTYLDEVNILYIYKTKEKSEIIKALNHAYNTYKDINKQFKTNTV
jgi:hypothetical protein